GATVTLSGAQTAITLLPGGKGVVTQANFFGQASGARIYYADGVNRMWEFDGTTLVPLNTAGLVPKYVTAHKRYLFYSVNSSLFYRAVGNPYATTGGAESYLRELGWREFASHLLYHFPHTSDQPKAAPMRPW
ncbi:MAG: hypothetical protein EBW49_08050, partial [Betaproteobacteria bacterium]|nr:hypothetical protein [Betaproteobacteria bacterium]